MRKVKIITADEAAKLVKMVTPLLPAVSLQVLFLKH